MKAIIVGATSGLGREIAKRLAAEGWSVGAAGRRVAELESLKAEIEAASQPASSAGAPESRILIAPMDVTKPEATAALDTLIEQLGAPDLLFYAAGMGFQNRELEEDTEIRTVQTNCEGMVRIVDRFVNFVRSHSEHYTRKAHVAVISSVAGTAALGSAPAYSATKKMQQTYVTALAQLARMEKIPVQFTDIRPGFVRTPILNPEKNYPMVMTLEQGADHIMRALKRRQRICIFDWRFRVIVFLWRLIPRCIWERITIVRN